MPYETSPPPAHLAGQVKHPTEPQAQWVRDICRTRQLPAKDGGDTYAAAIIESLDRGMMSKADASDFITNYKDCPRKPNATSSSPWPDVKPGRYALRTEDLVGRSDNNIRFFKVDRPEEGRWAGFTFLTEGVGGGHGDLDWRYPIKERETKKAILNAILKDPLSALRRYGMEVGHCGHCGRTLTNEESRKFGIGPVCRRSMGL